MREESVYTNSPSQRWKDRFHRMNPPFGNCSTFVSRPTFDFLRSASDGGKSTFHAITQFLKFAAPGYDEEILLAGNHYESEGLHSFSFKIEVRNFRALVLLNGPFDVATEMNECKKGIFIHVIPFDNHRPREITKNEISDFCSEVVPLNEKILTAFDSTRRASKFEMDTPENSDSNLLSKWHKYTVNEEIYKELNSEATDLAAARLLPTDILFDYLETSDNSKTAMAKSRQFMSRQFNEVRLVEDVSKANVEQIQAIDAYQYSKSKMENISGRPGVGKSTILHINSCEALLQRGPLRGERKILYVAATRNLIEEAKSEIEDLLNHLYYWEKDSRDQVKALMKNIHFAVQEDFLLGAPGTLGPLNDADVLKQALDQIPNDARWSFWKDDENFFYLQRILQNFVYGVFGSPTKFCEWVPRGRDDSEISKRFTRAFNFFFPEREFLPPVNDGLSSDFYATYFWNPIKHQNGKKTIDVSQVRGLALLIEEGGLLRSLVDHSIGKTTGMWELGGIIHGMAESLFSEDGLDFERENLLWEQIKDHGYDAIFVDESQDFSARSIATFLQYFSNRGAHRSANHYPFTFVTAGDEFQTIHGTLFQGHMIHISKIYTDWKLLLLQQSPDDYSTYSGDLPNPNKRALRASYRTSDLQTRVVDNIVKDMRNIAQEVGHRRAGGISTYGIRRHGVIAGLPHSNLDSEKNWVAVLDQLKKQLGSIGEGDSAPKVGFIFPKAEIKHFNDIIEQFEFFENLALSPDLRDYVGSMKKSIEKKYREIKRTDKFPDETLLAQLKEVGFYDIKSIKGLTLPVAITLNQPVMFDDDERWFEKLTKLSLSLVMISRSQFGLFMAAEEEISERTVGAELWEEMHDEEEEGAMKSTLKGVSFLERLSNSSPSEISPKILLRFARKEWYVERNWTRLQKSALLELEEEELVNVLKKIFLGVRLQNLSIDDKYVDALLDFTEKAIDAENTFGPLPFFEELAGRQLKHFLAWQDLCRINEDKSERLKKIDLIEKIRTLRSSTRFSNSRIELVDSLLGIKEIDEKILQMNHPWSMEGDKFQQIVLKDILIKPPYFDTGPWELTPPPEIPIEQRQFWIQEIGHWSPPSNVLESILDLQPLETINEQNKKILRWCIDYTRQDAAKMIEKSIEEFEKGDAAYFDWILKIVIAGRDGPSPNHGTWLHNQILEYLISNISNNQKLCAVLGMSIENLENSEEIEKFVWFINNLSVSSNSDSKGRSKNKPLQYLDGFAIFRRWVSLANSEKKFLINKDISSLVKGDLNSFLIKLSSINNLHGNIKLPHTQIEKIWDIKLDTIQQIETRLQLEEHSLQEFSFRILERFLTDRTLPYQGSLDTLGDHRSGFMYMQGLRINPHFKSPDRDLSQLGISNPDSANLYLFSPAKREEKACNGGHMQDYNSETDKFRCSKCKKVIEIDKGYLWYKKFYSSLNIHHSSHKGDFLIELVKSHIESAKMPSLEFLARELRKGRLSYKAIFDTKQSLVVKIDAVKNWPHGESDWRRLGHLNDWTTSDKKTDIPVEIAQRFDSAASIEAMGVNGKTFDAYNQLYSLLKSHPGKNKINFNSIIKAFMKGGAIREARALWFANLPLNGKEVNEQGVDFLNHFIGLLRLEFLLFDAHNEQSKEYLDDGLDFIFSELEEGMEGFWQWGVDMAKLRNWAKAPFSIYQKVQSSYGNEKWWKDIISDWKYDNNIERRLPTFETDMMGSLNWNSIQKQSVQPYISRSNAYFVMSSLQGAWGEAIVWNKEFNDEEVDEVLLKSLISKQTDDLKKGTVNSAMLPRGLFKGPERMHFHRHQIFESGLVGELITEREVPKEIIERLEKEFLSSSALFWKLLSAYRSGVKSGDYTTYYDSVFRIFKVKGLTRIKESNFGNGDGGFELEDFGGVLYSPEEHRQYLENYMRQNQPALSENMIHMFLNEVESGKPELDRMLKPLDGEVWEHYQALLFMPKEEE